MKNKGFTLSEILITLGVIGIVAAATLPGLLGRNVDNDKARVIAIVKSVEDATQEFLNDPNIYYPTEKTSGSSTIICEGLGCWEKPRPNDYNDDYTKLKKYPRLIANKLNKVGEINCKTTYTTFQPAKNINCRILVSASTTGKTQPSIYDDIKVQQLRYELYITFNNTPTDKISVYSADNKEPNGYKFTIDNNGRVHGNDPLSKAYLMNPTELNNKEADYEKAEEILAAESEKEED